MFKNDHVQKDIAKPTLSDIHKDLKLLQRLVFADKMQENQNRLALIECEAATEKRRFKRLLFWIFIIEIITKFLLHIFFG